ncbi:indolepyruvate ferredoxin oxidoreductase family protein [Novosphingobium album (ex Hu et al. 2023)]|uniref:Indolepyruvate ferredoxin oxidoreductase family protein n=1 Tax=Novosphingobium album (ex Hu et al. 2023) TaxID=2930093 RepID=A0ABT0B7A7_9SPHN|nr:indolepyruvate ferredoxin oxidoreductase family protein [Novosphingobium album (ex Hu et al. 2023)]MCJ2180738.1 indolepyruvate ferredoxin oxidoreductase family protein [Novosphingobium album (ex Hu et al. 2023)]
MTQASPVSLDDKWTVTRGRIMLNGTQALARVLLAQAWLDRRAELNTAGYITGYRGSPLGNVDSTLWSIGKRLDDAGIRFQPGVNEDLAATAVAGTQQIEQVPGARYDGVFSAWYGKGPGVDRAGDAFKHGHYAGTSARGGVVLFYGEDHAGKSSTVSYQSEQALAANLIPSFYPADAGEILHYGLLALALSRHSGLWTSVKCVNEVVEQTATVDIDLDGFSPRLPDIVNAPPEGLHAGSRPFNPLRAEQIVIEHRLPQVIPFVRANGLDRVIFRSDAPRLAIVSTGKSHGDVLQALDLLGIGKERARSLGISLYKVGCIWPLDGETLADFAEGHETLLIVEEKKSFIEAQIARTLVGRSGAPRLIGKTGEDGGTLLSSVLQLEPADIASVIAGRLERLGVIADGPAFANAPMGCLPMAAPQAQMPRRSPFFCSGCPHNRSTRVPEGSLSMTGIGCHTMVHFIRPKEAMLGLQMGAEGANWMGLAPFTDTPHIFQNMGDGTYYHSGLLAIRAAVASGVNITYKILYNDAVAMTGGQPVDGPLSVSEIAQQVRHEGVKRIVVLSDNPGHHRKDSNFPPDVTIAHREELDNIQRELRETSGCTVLIYEQTCAAEKRRRRKRGKFPNPAKRMFIAEDVCEGCGDCSVQSTCVSIVPKDTAFGRKRAIDQSSCNKDYSCNDGFCPSFITVHGAEPRKPRGVSLDDRLFAGLPQPAVASGACNIMVAGIGGTGVITVGALIGMAAHIEGRAASLYDMTGLAQKNGAVFSHIRIAETPADIHAQRLGRGEADLVLAFDLVAALQPESDTTMTRGRTRAIANEAVVPTASFQMDREAVPEPEVLLARLNERIGPDAMTVMDASNLALKLLGDTIGANLMVVGMAAQQGLLPVSTSALEQAIALNGVAVKFNTNAFRLGRLFAADPDAVRAMVPESGNQAPLPETVDELIAHRSAHLAAYQNEALAARYRKRTGEVRDIENGIIPGSEVLTRVFARNYAKLLAIKDEYEVARMLTDPALHARIGETFDNGARIAFNMAPPLLPGRMPNGRPRKREFPGWLAMPVLRLLKSLNGLRGSALDIFGHTAERRSERALLAHYEALTERVLARLTRANFADTVALLDEVAAVRGFGPVKEAALAAYHRKIEAAEHRLNAVRPASPADRMMPVTVETD